MIVSQCRELFDRFLEVVLAMFEEFVKLFNLLGVLFVSTCLFCWLFTSNWFLGPIVTIASSLGGVLLISWLGVLVIDSDRDINP